MKFTYKARTKEGKIETGVIEASGHDAAVSILQKYDIFVTSLQEQTSRPAWLDYLTFESQPSKKDLAIFSRQLAVMLESRVPVVQSLTSLAIQTTKNNFKKIILEIAKLIEEGIPLSEAFSRFPDTFDEFYVNLVKSGEASGKISSTLYYISDNLEREHDILAQVRQAMVYPIFTIAVLFVVINIIIIFLLPKIEELIKEATINPPPFTLLMLAVYRFLEQFWWLILLLPILLITFAIFYFRTKSGKKIYDTYSLKIPLLGDILKKVFLTRFCGNISTLMSAGISINRALKITEDTVNSVVYKKIIKEVGDKVSQGEKISSVLIQDPEHFPSFVVQMIKTGEETGKLDKTLLEVVNFYQKEIKRAIDLLLTFLEPLLIIVLGSIVGVLAVSVFGPLYGALGSI